MDESFRVRSDAVVPIGRYSFREASIDYTSNTARSLSGSIGFSKGGYFDGNRSSVDGGIIWEPSYHLRFNLSAERNNVSLQGRSFTADVYGAEIKYTYSTRLYFGTYVQYNAAIDQVVTNLRMSFVHAPLSYFFAVYTERRDVAGGGLKERYLTVKLTKLLEF